METYAEPEATNLLAARVEASLRFYCDGLGMSLLDRYDIEAGRFSILFLSYAGYREGPAALELTYNWDPEVYGEGRNFGHLAFEVDDIYATCARLMKAGVTINRPPRDGRMAFVRSPDNISIELLQKGAAQAKQEPWSSMPNTGKW